MTFEMNTVLRFLWNDKNNSLFERQSLFSHFLLFTTQLGISDVLCVPFTCRTKRVCAILFSSFFYRELIFLQLSFCLCVIPSLVFERENKKNS